MKQLKQSPVAKIIAWILVTVSALMLLAGTAGAYAISELGFYTRSVEDIRQEQFERIAGKYSARVLLNLNNTENETYFKDTNFRYGVVEASNYEELEKLDLNQQSTYVQSNFDEKVSLDNPFRNTSRYPLNISSEELMERFVRGDSSRNTEGNGLGLSIAGSLMELMHGKMQLFVDGDLFKVVLEFDRCEAS